MLCCEGGHTQCAAFLLDQGANVAALDGCSTTSLIAAAANGHLLTVRLLVEQAGADVNAVDYDGDGALAQAGGNGHSVVVEYLLERGATCDFFTAAMVGHLPVVIEAVEQVRSNE